MAEIVAGPLIEMLISSIQREITLVWVVKTEVMKLSKTLSAIRDVLADAEEKQIKDKKVRDWLIKLKDVAYDAQDVLDDWATDELDLVRVQPDQSDEQSKDCTNVRVRYSFQSFFDYLKRLIFYYKIAKNIKESRERFDGIVKEMSDFSLIKKSMDVEGSVVPRQSISSGRETSSTSAEPQIYGRETDKENFVKRLLENINNEHAVSVCPIVGIGGLGKTTLAQFVYNDDRIQKHFDVKIWICVSDDFNVKKLLKKVIEAVIKSRYELDDLDLIQNEVKKKLKKKRFLLVLDDVWSDKQEEWNSLMSSLTVGAQGSSVIVTTRLDLTSIRGINLEPYQLDGLSEGDCWALFRTYAFGVGKEEKPSLKKIGKEIIKKCGGLPLAVKALGSLLWFKDEDTQWEAVRDNKIWELEEQEEELGTKGPKILPALRLSYNNLSSRARQCFGYCCLFPKDYEMRKEDLIHLWLANDLLHLRNMEPNEVGKIVFDELKSHSFLQIVEEQNFVIKFKIHDLLHDLASSVMKKEHSLFEVEVGMPPNTTINCSIQDDEIKTRHVSLILLRPSKSSSVDVSSIHQFFSPHQRHLRTLLLISNLYGHADPRLASDFISVISGQKNLRWLMIDEWRGEISLPPSFGDKLKHLRYLSFSGCGISSLHGESFSGMKNLQILDLSGNLSLELYRLNG
ncbi:hypothetical protein Sjap_008240 [Stephania japonica]|uniref:Uncharacterized protein n=1 Tax=Stephania japonica TaxID=461633 RepID=A0AAP0JP44_9MAGN